jgi:hypothetical protein
MELPKIPNGHRMVLMFPKIQALMTGVYAVDVRQILNKRLIVMLTYTDHTVEERECTRQQWHDFDNVFNIVSYVQDGRK